MGIVHKNRPLNGRYTATVEDFDRLMAVNARSTFLCYKHAAKQMIAQGRGGRIIGAKISYPSPWHMLM
jgi:NAD(P)-dependent dehydrogenase (short-subunit alcohol dehydrogenase family)